VENFSHSFVEKKRRVNPVQFSTLWKTISADGGGVFHKKSTKEENVFSQKIPVSGGLPVLIPKNQRFLSKTHCVSCGIL